MRIGNVDRRDQMQAGHPLGQQMVAPEQIAGKEARDLRPDAAAQFDEAFRDVGVGQVIERASALSVLGRKLAKA